MRKTLPLAVLAALMALMLVAGPALWVLLVVMDRVGVKAYGVATLPMRTTTDTALQAAVHLTTRI